MYERHPSFRPPEGVAHLWRYLSFAKYISLLEYKALHFARSDILGDRFEGALTEADKEGIRTAFAAHLPKSAQDGLLKNFSETMRQIRRAMYISCWHESEYELDAMWRIYAADHGIAVRTTFDDLTLSLEYPEPIHAGRVTYIDFRTDTAFYDAYLFSVFSRKRLSFEHEKEVRLLLVRDMEGILGGADAPDVVAAPVDVTRMIKHVFVSPYAPAWLHDTVARVTKTYGLSFPVTQSHLAKDPVL
ncbi:MAG: DUF2971 domain-containing protein [Actinomycetota bacterium]|nr:DUF2971 domain-containing protein [Actinomycetota bacterium]